MSIRLLITLIALLTVNNLAIAQLPPVQWENSYGGTLDDEAFDMKLTSDGGSIVVGQTNSNDSDVSGNHGNYDYWVIKLSSTGALQWQRCLGGTGNQEAYSVQQTTDGGYVIAGTSNDTANGDITDSTWGYDYWIVKLDDTGAIQWQKSYGSTGNDVPASVIQTSDGGYMVAGIADSANGDVTMIKGMHDIWLIKLDDTGALQWQKTYGGSGDDYATSIIQTTDAGYIFTGYTNSNDGDVSGNHGSNDVWVVKISATGGVQWQKCYGGTQSDGAASIIRTADSNYVFAGFSYSTDGDLTKNQGHSDVWVAKIAASGSLIWQSSFGGLSYEQAQSVQQTVDGGFIAGGWSFSNDGDVFGNNGNGDYWAAKVSATGALQWQRCLGGSGNDQSYCIRQTPDQGFLLAGFSNSLNDDVTGNFGGDDFWVVKIAALSEVSQVKSAETIAFLPNPTTGVVKVTGVTDVTIKAFNMLGQEVAQADNSDQISLAACPAGMYFLKILDSGGSLLKEDKVVKQ